MRKILCSVVMLMLIGLIQVAGAATVATIGFTPNGPISGAGSPYSWDVYVTISAFAPNQVVSAYSLDISYDANILGPTLTPVSFSTKLGSSTSYEVLQDYSLAKSGVVNIAAVSLLSDVDLQSPSLQGTGARNITLATLFFNNPSSNNSTSLTADWSTHTGLRDVKGLSNMVISESSVVPEPSTYLLATIAGAAVVAAAWLRRRKGELA